MGVSTVDGGGDDEEEGGWVIVCFCFRGLLVRTSFLVELAEHFSDDLPHALQRLEVILGLVELLLGVLDLIAELTNPRVELLFVWCGSRWSVGRSVGGGDVSDLFSCPKKAFTQISNGRGVMGRGSDGGPGLRACDERLDSYLVLQHEPPILADRRLLGIGSLHRRRNLRGRHLAHSQTSLPLSTAQPPVWTLPDPGREGARVRSCAARPRRCGRVDRRRARVMRPAACVRVWHPTRAPREITPGLKLSNQARRLSVT